MHKIKYDDEKKSREKDRKNTNTSENMNTENSRKATQADITTQQVCCANDMTLTFQIPTPLLETMLEPGKDVVRLVYSTTPAYGDNHGNTFIAEGIVIRVHDGLELQLVEERHNRFLPCTRGKDPARFNLDGTQLRSLYIELIGEAVRGGDSQERYEKHAARPLLQLPTTAARYEGGTGFH